MELTFRFGFDAAHRFDHFPASHPNYGLHGHSFQAEVTIRGEPDPKTGFIVAFEDLESACLAARAKLDHRTLNDVPGLETPSLENLCLWLWKEVHPRMPALAKVSVRRDSAGQTCTYAPGG